MNKIISLIIFAAALSWTWNIIHTESAVGFETHSGIQVSLAKVIVDTVAEKRPEAKNIEIIELWTEKISDTKVRAYFSYKFSEPSENGEMVDQAIKGEAVLHREPSDEPGKDVWILQNVETNNDSVVFNEGSLITPDMETEATPETGVEEEPQVEGANTTGAPATETAPTTPSTTPAPETNKQ
ncbi:MAG: hypothetical protein ACLGGX_05965 [Bdellovibrionia bacterium]